MRLRTIATACALLAATASSGWAQTVQPTPQLPPVEVEGVPNTTPDPLIVPPPAGTGGGPWDLPLSYPGLDEISTGGINGITRTNRTIFDTPTNVTAIDQERLEEIRPQDMFQALQNEVGILMQRTAKGQSSPFIRGFTGQQIVVLVDGVRTNTSILRGGPNQYFNLMDPGMVSDIQVNRGSGSVLWGSDAIGGVINLVTRSPDSNRGNYGGGSISEIFSTADYGSYTRASGEGWAGPMGIYAGASYLNVSDLDTAGNLGRQPGTDYSQYSADMKWQTQLTQDSMLTVLLTHFEQKDVPRSDRFAPFVLGPPVNGPRPTWFDPQQRDLVYANLMGVSDSALVDAYTITASYQRNKEGLREIRSATRHDLGEFDVNTVGVTAAFTREVDGVGIFTYGADFYKDYINASKVRYNPVTGAVTPDVAQFPDGSNYDRMGTFLNWEIPVTERLDVIAGLRYENANARGVATLTDVDTNATSQQAFDLSYQDWIYSVGAVYELTDNWNLVGGIYEGYRAPNISDLVSTNTFQQNQQSVTTAGSLTLQPEHSFTYEVGMKFNTDRFRASVYEYWILLEDAIGTRSIRNAANTANVTVAGNIPHAYIQGTELNAEYLLEAGWSVYGNFFYTYGQDETNNVPFSRIPPTQGILGLRWREAEHRSWFEVYTWMVARADRYNPANNTDARFPVGGTPGYATLNTRMGTSFGACDQHNVSLNFENITDKAYRVLGSGVDGTGFNVTMAYERVW